jgi:hypothetical protein
MYNVLQESKRRAKNTISGKRGNRVTTGFGYKNHAEEKMPNEKIFFTSIPGN